MSWNVSYGLLIILSTIVTWGSATFLTPKTIATPKEIRKNKLVLWACLIINLGILFIYKYGNFFIISINDISEGLNLGLKINFLNVLLPVGISFYTFQAIGYTIDVYNGTIKPEKDFFTYALFVSFFPQLVAGPIERAKNLLPQFHTKHIFDDQKAMNGIQMMVWGYFMKICVADRAGLYVDAVYNNLAQHNGSSILLATFLFTIQIYCDFGGYSLIAIGVAKVMGFDLMENFHRPYFSTSIREFWKRWHISLSTWFMDYVYIPLGGNRCSINRHMLNLFITFLVSGIWHGANWTFFIWGAYHGILICINSLWHKFGPKITYYHKLHRIINTLCTFCLIMLGWILFRANSIVDISAIFIKIFKKSGNLFTGDLSNLKYVFVCIFILFTKDFLEGIGLMLLKKRIYSDIYIAVVFSFILFFGYFGTTQFIYFQF